MPWGLLPLNVQELRETTGKKWKGEEKSRKNEKIVRGVFYFVIVGKRNLG